MTIPLLDDLKGIDFSKKYLNPFNCVYYYNNFMIYNNIDYFDLENKSIWYKHKIIFNGHEYQFGSTTKIFFLHDMSRLGFHDKFRGQIPYRSVFGSNLKNMLKWIPLDRVLLIERLIECLKYILKPYDLNLQYSNLYKLCEDICGISLLYNRPSGDYLTINECKNIFKKNNINIDNIKNIVDDLNNVRFFKYDEFPLDFYDLNISDDELSPKYYNTIEFRYDDYGIDYAMINPECLLKEFVYDKKLEFKARYINFLLKFKKSGLKFWIDHALKNNHIHDPNGNGLSYELTKKGKDYLDENIHYTYMQPFTFTYKEFITLCEKNVQYTPQEILCCLANEDWITLNNFDWKKYVKQDLNTIEKNVIKEFQGFLKGKIKKYNQQNNFVMNFNNPNLSDICRKLKNAPIPSIHDYWQVLKVNDGQYSWKYSYYLFGESGDLLGVSLEDLKQQVISKNLPWDKAKIIMFLKNQREKNKK